MQKTLVRLTLTLGAVTALSVPQALRAQADPMGPWHPLPHSEQGRMENGPMEGIDISPEERGRLQGMYEQHKGEMERLQRDVQAAERDLQAARARNDMAGMTTASAALRTRHEAMQRFQTERLAEMRNILRDDQRPRFDHNVAAMRERMNMNMHTQGRMNGMPGPNLNRRPTPQDEHRVTEQREYKQGAWTRVDAEGRPLADQGMASDHPGMERREEARSERRVERREEERHESRAERRRERHRRHHTR